MTDVQLNGHREDADTPPAAAPEVLTVPRDTSFEHPLDETAPKPEPVHDGDGIAIPRLGGERAADHPRAPADAGRHPQRGRASTSTPPGSTRLFHLLRSPMYLVLGVVWAVVGVVRIANGQRQWWWVDGAVVPAVQGRGRRQLAGVAQAPLRRPQGAHLARRGARRRGCSRSCSRSWLIAALGPW